MDPLNQVLRAQLQRHFSFISSPNRLRNAPPILSIPPTDHTFRDPNSLSGSFHLGIFHLLLEELSQISHVTPADEARFVSGLERVYDSHSGRDFRSFSPFYDFS